MPSHYRTHIDFTRTERKIALAKLAADRPELIAVYQQATLQLPPPDATDWDLISSILNAEFRPVRQIDRRVRRR